MGIKCPKITYPEFFEGGLIGGMVNAPIAHREVFLIVPYSIIISLDKCHRDPVMGKVFAQNPELFTKRHKDWEQLTLTVFLMY